MPRGNPSPKLAITIDPDIHKHILAAAARDGVSVSAWMTAAARQALERRAGLAAVALWEKQHGRRYVISECQLRTPETGAPSGSSTRTCPGVQVPGSIPMRSSTAARMRCLQPRYRGVVGIEDVPEQELNLLQRSRLPVQ